MAARLKKELEAADCDRDCHIAGTRWSRVFALNGIILISLSVTYVLFAIGSCVFAVRILAACLNQFLGCVHFFGIIYALVLRFRLEGRLAN